VSAFDYYLCNIPLIYRSPLKKSDHISPTYLCKILTSVVGFCYYGEVNTLSQHRYTDLV
jgi:hypothetical protein